MNRRCALLALAAVAVGWMGCGPASPPSHAVRIMPLGDSITQGNLRFISYRRALWQRLTQAGYAVDFVGSLRRHRGGWSRTRDYDRDHEGHWGWRIDEILAHLPDWLDQARPEVVLLHLGTNDAFREEPVEQVAAEWMSLLRLLGARESPPVVLAARLIPARGRVESMHRVNEALAAAWARAPVPGLALHWVDLFSDFDPERDTYDGVHPNAAGEDKIAQRWFEALRAILPPPELKPTF